MFQILRHDKVKFERTPERVQLIAESLRDKILEQSENSISFDDAENLAYRCVAKMDFNNKFQMHRSLDSYAEGIIRVYERNRTHKHYVEDDLSEAELENWNIKMSDRLSAKKITVKELEEREVERITAYCKSINKEASAKYLVALYRTLNKYKQQEYDLCRESEWKRCLIFKNGRWRVGFVERGNFREQCAYNDVDDACLYMINKIFPRVKKILVKRKYVLLQKNGRK